MTVTCPNCGSEIPIPNRKKKSIQCPYCDMGGLELDLDYFDEENGQPVTGWKSFEFQHPRAAKAVKATGYAAVAAMLAVGGIELAKDKFAELTASPEVESADTSPIPAPSTDSSSDSYSPEETTQENISADLLPIDSKEASDRLLHYDLQKRHLPKNQKASTAKREQANAIGIDIGTEYTLVDPYDRPYRKKSST